MCGLRWLLRRGLGLQRLDFLLSLCLQIVSGAQVTERALRAPAAAVTFAYEIRTWTAHAAEMSQLHLGIALPLEKSGAHDIWCGGTSRELRTNGVIVKMDESALHRQCASPRFSPSRELR